MASTADMANKATHPPPPPPPPSSLFPPPSAAPVPPPPKSKPSPRNLSDLVTKLALDKRTNNDPGRLTDLLCGAQIFLDQIAKVGQHSSSERLDVQDVFRATELWEEVVQRTSTKDPNYNVRAGCLAYCYFMRQYQVKEGRCDIDRAVKLQQDLVDRTPHNDPRREERLEQLASFYASSFVHGGARGGVKTHLQKAIGLYTQASLGKQRARKSAEVFGPAPVTNVVKEGSTTSCETPGLVEFAASFVRRYQRLGFPLDLDIAIVLLQSGLQTSRQALTKEDPFRISVERNLARAFHLRWKITHASADIDAAVDHQHDAFDKVTFGKDEPGGDLSYVDMAGEYAMYLFSRYSQKNEVSDLDSAIDVGKRTLSLAKDSPIQSTHTNLLVTVASFLVAKYHRTQVLATLNEAIVRQTEAVNKMDSKDAHLPARFTDLATFSSLRFKKSEQLADLTSAIEIQRRALELTSPENPSYIDYLSHLGICLSMRYHRTKDVADLIRALEVQRHALEKAPAAHPDRVTYTSNLSRYFFYSYIARREVSHLDAAISLGQGVVNGTSGDAPERTERVCHLALALTYRYSISQQHQDLDKAIEFYEEGLKKIGRDDPFRVRILTNLSLCLYLSGRRLPSRNRVLDRAIALSQAALENTSDTDPERVVRLGNLAIYMASRYALSREFNDLSRAIDLQTEALKGVSNESERIGHLTTLSFLSCLASTSGPSQINRASTPTPTPTATTFTPQKQTGVPPKPSASPSAATASSSRTLRPPTPSADPCTVGSSLKTARPSGASKPV